MPKKKGKKKPKDVGSPVGGRRKNRRKAYMTLDVTD